MFYPPKGVCESWTPKGFIDGLSNLLCVPERYYASSFLVMKSTFLKSWKCFIPQKESVIAEPEGVHWRSFHFIMCSKKGTEHLRFWLGNRRFWNLRNVLSLEGSLRKRNPKWSIDGLSILLCVPKRVLGIFVFGKQIRVSEIFEIFYCVDGWVGGWVDGWGVIFCPLRFSLFSSMLTSNMCLFQKWA